MTTTPRALIAEDEPLLADALARMLQRQCLPRRAQAVADDGGDLQFGPGARQGLAQVLGQQGFVFGDQGAGGVGHFSLLFHLRIADSV